MVYYPPISDLAHLKKFRPSVKVRAAIELAGKELMVVHSAGNQRNLRSIAGK